MPTGAARKESFPATSLLIFPERALSAVERVKKIAQAFMRAATLHGAVQGAALEAILAAAGREPTDREALLGMAATAGQVVLQRPQREVFRLAAVAAQGRVAAP